MTTRNELRDQREKLKARIQQLEGEARERKTYVQKRIEAALGEYGGDWLQEAEERLTRRRMMTLDDVAAVVERHLDDMPHTARIIAADVCEYLGVHLARSPEPADGKAVADAGGDGHDG